MNDSLDRLIEGIIATLRHDVIPRVGDAYARGQAIGVIDVLNNVADRIEWARAPLAAAIADRVAVLDDVRRVSPRAPCPSDPREAADWRARASSAELLAERDRLDGVIADLVGWVAGPGAGDGGAADVTARLRAHMHADVEGEVRRLRKPLFAEIAKG